MSNDQKQFNENYQLQTDVPVPVPGSRELLIRVVASGFCYTDYQVYEGAYNSKLPVIGSHEVAGRIVALGPNVSGDWKIGDRVGVYFIRGACGTCTDCTWHSITHNGNLCPRYCQNKTMVGIKGADGGFAQYMIMSDLAILKLPDDVSFEQAAPLMCAGATVWNALLESNLQTGQTVAIVGIGGLGNLAVQFAKALGYRVVAASHHDPDLECLPPALRPDIVVSYTQPDSAQEITEFTGGIGLDAVIVCTPSAEANDWAAHQLQPRGTCVVLGLPTKGFHFDAFNLVFRQIVVKGSLYADIHDLPQMLDVVSKHKIRSHITVVPLEEAEELPKKVAAHEFKGRVVVKI